MNLDAEISARRQPGDRIAILYLDVGEFKRVNDSFGHNSCDAA